MQLEVSLKKREKGLDIKWDFATKKQELGASASGARVLYRDFSHYERVPVFLASGWRNNDTANIMYCLALPEHFEMRPSANVGTRKRQSERVEKQHGSRAR